MLASLGAVAAAAGVLTHMPGPHMAAQAGAAPPPGQPPAQGQAVAPLTPPLMQIHAKHHAKQGPGGPVQGAIGTNMGQVPMAVDLLVPPPAKAGAPPPPGQGAAGAAPKGPGTGVGQNLWGPGPTVTAPDDRRPGFLSQTARPGGPPLAQQQVLELFWAANLGPGVST